MGVFLLPPIIDIQQDQHKGEKGECSHNGDHRFPPFHAYMTTLATFLAMNSRHDWSITSINLLYHRLGLVSKPEGTEAFRQSGVRSCHATTGQVPGSAVTSANDKCQNPNDKTAKNGEESRGHET